MGYLGSRFLLRSLHEALRPTQTPVCMRPNTHNIITNHLQITLKKVGYHNHQEPLLPSVGPGAVVCLGRAAAMEVPRCGEGLGFQDVDLCCWGLPGDSVGNQIGKHSVIHGLQALLPYTYNHPEVDRIWGI